MLETKSLLLKPYSNEIAEYLNKWENDKELLYFNDENPNNQQTIGETKDYLKKIIKDDSEDIVRFIIYSKETQMPIGFCMIALIDDVNKNCKIGLTIGEKHEWGKGYGNEVLKELIRYSFEELELNRIGAEIYSFNTRSQKLFENNGFKKEGIIRELIIRNEKFEDSYEYGLLRREWK